MTDERIETKPSNITSAHTHTHTLFPLPGEKCNTENLIRVTDKGTVGSGCLSEFIVISSGTPSSFQTH